MVAHVVRIPTSLRSEVESQIRQVALEHGRILPALSDSLKLLESGLDSLSLATVVIRLADVLGIDPFKDGEGIEFPVTFGDLVRAYEELDLSDRVVR